MCVVGMVRGGGPLKFKKFVINSSPEDEDEVEKPGGFLANLSPDELSALEEKKAKAAALLLAKRGQERLAREKAEREAKQYELRKKRAYVRGSKVCMANRVYEEGMWFICEVCSKKFHDVEQVEEHVQTDKHKNNFEWYSKNPLPGSTWGDNEEDDTSYVAIPDCVTYDEPSGFYICSLCSAKAGSEVVLQAHLQGKEHIRRAASAAEHAAMPSVLSAGKLPAYVEYDNVSEMYMCMWCEKRASTLDMMEIHLGGKEHAKKCGNIGLPLWGEVGHWDQCAAYVAEYGHDVWARQHHWPSYMQDDPSGWKCIDCNKKFLTPSSVNDHVAVHSGKRLAPDVVVVETAKPKRKQVVPEVAEDGWSVIGEPPKRPAPVIEPGWNMVKSGPTSTPSTPVMCRLCMLPVGSMAELKIHEETDEMHRDLMQRAKGGPKATVIEDSFDV